MTRHAKRVTIAQICAYLISKTKSGTVSIVWQSKAFVSSSERNVTLNVQYDTRAKRLECEMARVSDTTSHLQKVSYSQNLFHPRWNGTELS